MSAPHIHPISVYYEDTDFSGVVYHANYLKYCERAREHLLGRDELVRLYRDDGVGFVVYEAKMKFKDGARFGDELEVRTTVKVESDFRLRFDQPIYRVGGVTPLVEVEIQLVAVDRTSRSTRLPASVLALLPR